MTNPQYDPANRLPARPGPPVVLSSEDAAELVRAVYAEPCSSCGHPWARHYRSQPEEAGCGECEPCAGWTAMTDQQTADQAPEPRCSCGAPFPHRATPKLTTLDVQADERHEWPAVGRVTSIREAAARLEVEAVLEPGDVERVVELAERLGLRLEPWQRDYLERLVRRT